MRPLSPAREALLTVLLVTVLVGAASQFVPLAHVSTVVGLVFLAATWWHVWRRDDAVVERMGLALGGIVIPGPIEARRLARDGVTALLWAGAVACVVFVPFYFGWRAYWHVTAPFRFPFTARELGELFAGQLMLVALPEEAFYRGYVQTRLDDGWPKRLRVLGADVGVALLATSAVFAIGHIVTIRSPARLAVFFPSLLFGWLRSRTRGVGASVLLHALSNAFSETLGRGYGLY